jgi:hypothetical protein
MKLEIWQDFSDRLDQAHAQALKLQFGVKELWIMYRAVQSLLRQASIEMVECRRRKKPTDKYMKIMQQAEEALKNFESHVILATLMKKD